MDEFDKENIYLWLPTTIDQLEELEKLQHLLRRIDADMQIKSNEKIGQYSVKITYSNKRVKGITQRNAGKKKILPNHFSAIEAVAMIQDGFTQEEVAKLNGMTKWTLIRRMNDAKTNGIIPDKKLQTGKKTGRKRIPIIVRFRGGVSTQTYSDQYRIGCYEANTNRILPYLISEEKLNEAYRNNFYAWVDSNATEHVEFPLLKSDQECVVEIFSRYENGMYLKGRAAKDMTVLTYCDFDCIHTNKIPFWVTEYYRWKGIIIPSNDDELKYSLEEDSP